jgi:alkanesulfonate monooxygenase SsuD/methylene tetrahydromethanopterin reductase-like flavin-dependent oxidoreductase (luciferase family)
MEIGVFQGASVGPRPWDEAEPRRILRDVEIGVAADKAGFDYFWAPEHHSLEEYSHNSSSHLSCLTVGLQTENIRLVTGIFNLCPAINHPVRVAEQIAYIDIVTGGRIELGTGRGSGSTEVNTFGLDANETRPMWDEAIREIPKMWTQDLYSFEGKYFQVPERCILPKPISKPHPPLWVTASNPPTVEAAAKMGIGVAMFSFGDPDLLAPLVEIYKETIATKCEPISDVVNDKIMAICPLMCLEDGEEARSLYAQSMGRIAPHFTVFFDTIPHNFERFADVPRPIPQHKLREMIAEAGRDPELAGPMAISESPDAEFYYQNGMAVGSPDEVLATSERYKKIGLDQVVTTPGAGWKDPHDKVIESIYLTGEKVIPRLKA